MLSGTPLSTKTIKKVKPVVYALDKDRDERKINDLLFEADFGNFSSQHTPSRRSTPLLSYRCTYASCVYKKRIVTKKGKALQII